MNIPRNAKKIIEILQHNSHDAYVVGGCVRDTLMCQIPGDWDITTSATPREVKALFRRTIDTGIEHGTVTVLMPAAQENGSLMSCAADQKKIECYEVTTYRVDGDYSDHRRPDKVQFSTDLLEDLRRRDFTINAMAYNDRTGLVDQFDGQGDLERRTIRAVGNADERFNEDALRMLRAIRFSAKLDFGIEQATYDAIRKHAPELTNVSAERICTELYRTITSDAPQKLRFIWDTGLAPYICKSFTKIEDPRGLMTSNSADDLQRDGAACVHLNYAPWAPLMRNITAEDAKTILKELKADNDTIRSTCLLIDEYKRQLPRTAYEIKKSLRRIGEELFTDLLLLKQDEYPQEELDSVRSAAAALLEAGEPYQLSQLEINGNDIIALGYKGKEVGRVLEMLLDRVMRVPSLNDHKKLTVLAERNAHE